MSKILIVEDDITIHNLLKELLQEYQLYQDLISEQNYQIIIQDNGYCLDTTNNLIYKLFYY